MNAPAVDQLIGKIYDAVTAPDGFQHFIDLLTDCFQLKAAMLFTQNLVNGEAKGMWQRGMERRWMESYAVDYGREDQLAGLIASSAIAHFYASNIHLMPDDYHMSRFYREWIVPQGVGYAAGAVILREGVWATQVVLQRSPHQPPFTRDELVLLGRLVSHLQRAVQMRHRFLELESRQTLLTAGLDAFAVPSIMLDEWGRVVYVNSAARRFLKSADGLWIDDRHLCTDKPVLTKQLSVEVLVAVDASRGNADALPGVIHISRTDRAPYTVVVVPMRSMETGPKGAALAFVHDPSNTSRVAPEIVECLFSLTSAEAELVVALCNGKTLDEAAVLRQTSIHTVRSQLKSIFAKTGTHRQSDLLTLVLSSPAYFAACS